MNSPTTSSGGNQPPLTPSSLGPEDRQFILDLFDDYDTLKNFSIDNPIENSSLNDQASRLIDLDLLRRESGFIIRPRWRVNELQWRGERVYLTTDFPERLEENRLFCWADEAAEILTTVDESFREYRMEGSRVLDLCCGVGSVGLALASHWGRQLESLVGVDVNPRAIERAEFNFDLNLGSRDENQVAKADYFVSSGLNDVPGKYLEKKFDLITLNPPMRIGSPRVQLHENEFAKGGRRLVMKLLKQAAEYLRPGGTIILLAYVLGDEEGPPREFEQELMECFEGTSNPKPTIEHTPVGGKVWRFGNEKAIRKNPMPLEYTILRVTSLLQLERRRKARGLLGSSKTLDPYEAVDLWVEWVESEKRKPFDKQYHVGGEPRYTTHLCYETYVIRG